ncbi:DUF4271 domain-containing protein [Lacinutrix sp. WUR7]|uniref:DUF4271 domain-containing protein n=1 Tax=Lacinutrix sp. WUR7 TaxID=2653681 RepID=UPI00193D3AF5|nr:DUF4271 domain-containing protein [Lacinutrix sp. WUR7]QRM88366.1 DUF4271 domain-containing protein [Lacinutrix sp. WUR7]
MLREIISNEIFTVLLLLCLVLVATTKVLYTKRFHDFTNVLGNFRYLKVYSRDLKLIDGFDALLFINLLISTSIFSVFLYKNFVGEIEDISIFLIKVFIGIAILLLAKTSIERLLGSLFNIESTLDFYVFQKMSYKIFFGILLIPINFILLFSVAPSPIILQIIVIVFILINCISIIVSYKTYQSLIKSNLFYFILYLCTLEISPYLVLYKLFIDYS